MTFGIILFACLLPVAVGVIATMVDEELAMRGGYHKVHH